MIGTIVGVLDSGTIVTMLVQPDEGGESKYIHWDWRMFKDFFDGVGETPPGLVGMRVEEIDGVVYPLETPQ